MEISLKSKSIVYFVVARYYNGNLSKIEGLVYCYTDADALRKAEQLLPKEIFGYRLLEIKINKYYPEYHNNRNNGKDIAPKKLNDAISVFSNKLRVNLTYKRRNYKN